jgi:hypothetical protein
MIVDLLRNDLSRVCEPGSMRVPHLCAVETYATVQHLVSEIRGRLRSDRDVWDLYESVFPGGSVTGAPKIRSMEIIAELEPTVRGPYCGSLFYVGGLVLLLFKLYQRSESRADPFAGASKAICLSIFFMLIFSSLMLALPGTVLWVFLGMGTAGDQFYAALRRKD